MNTNQRNKKGAKFVVFIKFVLKYLDNFVRQCLEFLRTQPVFDLLKTKMQNLSLLETQNRLQINLENTYF